MFPYFAIYRNLSLSSRIQSQQQLCNGASYSGFLNTKKINHAQKLLLNTQMSVVDIAVECENYMLRINNYRFTCILRYRFKTAKNSCLRGLASPEGRYISSHTDCIPFCSIF